MTQQQAQAAQLHAQADTLANKLATIQAEAGALQAQIDLNQAKYAEVSQNIADNQVKLAAEKDILAANIKAMYLDSSVTPLEMLASSSNISDYLDKEQYSDKIKSKIQDTMAEIEAIQVSLTTQQTQLTHLLADQKGQRQELAAKQQEASDLLASTQNDEASYEAQVKSNNSKIDSLHAQQAAAIAAASRRVSFGGGASGGSGCGGYPSNWCYAPQDSLIDSWGMYNRECVSYAAWAASVRFGHYVPYWGGRGNAKQWPGNAEAAGIPVDGNPHVGDVAIYMGGYYGHAMIVEQVKGGTVIVSSFNADNTGHFQYDEWSTSALQFIHFR